MLETALTAWHTAHGGRMVDFAGWLMPIQYSTIVAEHEAVRTRAGLFDISHMGRLYFRGAGARQAVDQFVTNDVTAIQPGQVRYALVTNDVGGILDDVLVYHLPDAYLVVVNASNREKILDWLAQQPQVADLTQRDETLSSSMIALQGPAALAIIAEMLNPAVTALGYYQCAMTQWGDVPVMVSRTGYTGEDGFEVILPPDSAVPFWEAALAIGASHGVVPTGLGARDTLRLEAGMPLYGHELDETIDPITAGLKFGVRLKAAPFPGRTAISQISETGPRRVRIGLELEGKRIARQHAAIVQNGTTVGEVTSGTFSPTLDRTIAMGYVLAEHGQPGTRLQVDVRGSGVNATVVPLPFYRRQS